METSNIQHPAKLVLRKKIEYIFQPEPSNAEEYNTNEVNGVSNGSRYLGAVKTIFWYLLALLLSMGISKLH